MNERLCELNLVWGPPLSGQLHWMVRVASQSVKEHYIHVPFESFNDEKALSEYLERISSHARQAQAQEKSVSLFYELPWMTLQHVDLLGTWLEKNSFLLEESSWVTSIRGLLSTDLDRLPSCCLQEINQFLKSSISSVVLLRSIEDEEDQREGLVERGLIKINDESHVEEELFWEEGEEAEGACFVGFDDHSPLDFYSQVIPSSFENLNFIQENLISGKYGSVWGAELLWINEDGRLEIKTFYNGRLIEWEASDASLIKQMGVNGVFFRICGQNLHLEKLKKTNKNKNLH